MKTTPTCLLSDLLHESVSGAGRTALFARRIQELLEKKFGHIIKRLFKASGGSFFLRCAGLTKIARLREAEFRITELQSVDGQNALLKRIDFLERKLADAETPATYELAWAPLIKASAGRAIHNNDSIAESSSDYNACDEGQISHCGGFNLAGRQILCVGGRAKLYPEYRRLIETSGGSLLIYRSGARADMDHLPTLLARADMVVCPVDCVNHHTYFTVKRYCKRSGKACVLLDRSGLPTFREGVAALAALAASPLIGETVPKRELI
ncbi:MAG: DUF2325 domain-containing protein [Nitrosospira sp.]|nr:DUF2325 domain-containing protein [Nitrosospira sp.]